MHTWSLGVEEQFYLVWPLICMAAVRIGRPLASFRGLVIASLIGTWWALPRDGNAVFFLLPFRVWELALGASVAAHPSPKWARSTQALPIAGAAFAVLTLVSGAIWPPGLLSQLLAVLGAASFIALGDSPNHASSILSTWPLVGLGRVSYAWYLWHWPLLVIARSTTIPDASGFEYGPLAAGLLLAAATYRWIERPARQLRIVDPIRVLVLGVCATLFIAITGIAMELRSIRLSTLPEGSAFMARLGRTTPIPCETEIRSMGCNLSTDAGDTRPGLLLWGDSFARALAPAVSRYARDTGSAARLLVRGGCPPFLGVAPATRRPPFGPDGSCRASLDETREQVRRESARVLGVVLAGRWTDHVASEDPAALHRMFDRTGRRVETASEVISLGLGETLDFAESMGLRVLIVGTPPMFPFEVPRCLMRASKRCFVERSFEAMAREQVRAGMQATIAGRRGVRWVELYDLLCPGIRCSAGNLEEPLLADRTHLSAIAAERRVLPALVRHLDWLRGLEPEAPGPG